MDLVACPHELRAFALALLSEAAYASDCVPLAFCEEMTTLSEACGQPLGMVGLGGVVARVGDDLVIAFRGTLMEPTTLPEWFAFVCNWGTNLSYRLKRYGRGGRVHEGFAAMADCLLPAVDELVERVEPRLLWLTGHSLGGALASLVSRGLDRTPEAVYTFGSPCVGDAAFAQTSAPQHFRFHNRNDFVCDVLPIEREIGDGLAKFCSWMSLPPLLQSDVASEFRHCGSVQYLDGGDRIRTEVPGRASRLFEIFFRGINQHRMRTSDGEGYIDSLLKLQSLRDFSDKSRHAASAQVAPLTSPPPTSAPPLPPPVKWNVGSATVFDPYGVPHPVVSLQATCCGLTTCILPQVYYAYRNRFLNCPRCGRPGWIP
jgi:hypothetical protein